MSILDVLLTTDAAEAFTPQETTFKSRKLQRILKADKPVEITLRELPYKRFSDLIAKQFDKKGDFDYKSAMRAKALLAAEGVVDPNLNSEELREHFGAVTPADLAEKLFGAALNEIADILSDLSGFTQSEEEAEEEFETIKNS